MTDYEKEIVRASGEIVKGIVSNDSVKVRLKKDKEGTITVWYSTDESEDDINIATFFDSVYRGLKAVTVDEK